jgi:hypothetical protein
VPKITSSFRSSRFVVKVMRLIFGFYYNLAFLQFYHHRLSCIMVWPIASSVPLCQLAKFMFEHRQGNFETMISQSTHRDVVLYVSCYETCLSNCSKVFLPWKRHIQNRLARLFRGTIQACTKRSFSNKHQLWLHAQRTHSP